MNLHFPDEVTNVLTINATDPKSGTAEFKATAIRVEAVFMDIQLLDAEPNRIPERAAIDAVVGAAAAGDGRVVRGDRHRRHLLLPALRAAQRRVGWVSEGALGYASRRLDVPPADAYGVASFYALLALEERPAEVLHMWHRPRLRARGRDRPARRASVAVPRPVRARAGVAPHDRR